MDDDVLFCEVHYRRTEVDLNGYFDIAAHGTPNGVQITCNGQQIVVDHKSVA